jgi:hypothetical protein
LSGQNDMANVEGVGDAQMRQVAAEGTVRELWRHSMALCGVGRAYPAPLQVGPHRTPIRGSDVGGCSTTQPTQQATNQPREELDCLFLE